MIAWDSPIKTVSEANSRSHWTVRAKRARAQRTAARAHTLAAIGRDRQTYAGRVVVVLERLAPSSGLDDDNLRGSLKAVRDGVADALGTHDRDARITWEYRQRRAKTYGVRVELLGAINPVE